VNFGDLLKRNNGLPPAPPRVVRLPPSAWADDREDKPVSPVEIGLRLPSEADITNAKEEAVKALARLEGGDHEDKVDYFNDALMRHLVASATCQPLNRTEHYFSMGADELAVRLTKDGLRRMYNELEALQASDNPGMPEAGDEEFAHLVAMWDRGIAWDFMPPEEAKKVRRLIEYARQQMTEAEMKAESNGHALVAG
jgi:hypothetical protein